MGLKKSLIKIEFYGITANIPIFDKQNECRLVKLDPWDPQVITHLYPNWNPLETCRINRHMQTELKNGTIRMLND
ncbi:unnamed protein product, partial [Wuchereria bancrofti]